MPSKTIKVKFWDGLEADLDVHDTASRSLSVKGATSENPLRFMEIYANWPPLGGNARSGFVLDQSIHSFASPMSYEEVKAQFFPVINGVKVDIGSAIELPPFCWRDADVGKLAVSFTYNANAFYRIFRNLSAEGKIPADQVNNLVDRGCVLLSQIYRAGQHHVIKHINNNFNMFLISRVVEEIVGREVYSSEAQELVLTRQSLEEALKLTLEMNRYSVFEKMGFALGMGVAFMEQHIRQRESAVKVREEAQTSAFGFYSNSLAIDDRTKFLARIEAAIARNGSFRLTAILDDATETVADLLWMQDLMKIFPGFRVNFLVNTAQTSINFSTHMLGAVLGHPSFRKLAESIGKQFSVTKIHCPFISFQTNYLPVKAWAVIDQADSIYVKGANFFETCQFPQKDSFHAFVVYGPVSRSYTGLKDYDPVFVHLPEGQLGFVHNQNPREILNLKHLVQN